MKTYTVLWEIDVDAKTALGAALVARECQSPDTEALQFSVFEKGSTKGEAVDLNAVDGVIAPVNNSLSLQWQSRGVMALIGALMLIVFVVLVVSLTGFFDTWTSFHDKRDLYIKASDRFWHDNGQLYEESEYLNGPSASTRIFKPAFCEVPVEYVSIVVDSDDRPVKALCMHAGETKVKPIKAEDFVEFFNVRG